MKDGRRRGPYRGAGSRTAGDRPAYRRDDETRPEPPKTRPAPYPDRPRPTFSELFRSAKPVIGVVHLKPLPGSPGYSGSFLDLLDHALSEARAIEQGGAAGVIVENFGDTPFYPDSVPPETIAAMTRLVTEIRKAVRIPVGVNVLRNDARGGVAVAAATGAGFVRVNVHTGVMVTDQGILAGRAYESVRLREVLRSRTLLFADIRVKHAAPLADFDLVNEAEDAVVRGRADALIITGPTTGRPTNLDFVRDVRKALPGVAVLVGSGVTAENADEVLRAADGCIVGTAIKVDGRIENPVDPVRLRRIVAVAEGLTPRPLADDRPPVPREEDSPPRFEERPPREDERPRRFEERPRREEERPRRFEERAPREEDQPPRHAVPEERPRRAESSDERPSRFEERPPRRPETARPANPDVPSGIEVWEPRAGCSPEAEPRPYEASDAGGGVEQFVAQPSALPVARESERMPRTRPEEPVGEVAGNGAEVDEPNEVRFGRTGHRKRRR